MANTLTWLHLSDLHMRRDALDDLRVVLDALWNDIPDQIEKLGGQLDFIAFTGDIAYSGKEEEYTLAEEYFFQPLLEKTGITPVRLFVVPGNHDVDWDLISLLNPEIPTSLTDCDKVTDFLKNDAKRRVLFAPMNGYTQFVQGYFGSFDDHQILCNPPYYYVQHLALGSHLVALYCFNSAWLSGFTKVRGEVTDQGHLLIGKKQVIDVLGKAEDATVRIALMHHPLNYLQEFDAEEIEGWLQERCDFVLQGHLHKPKFKKEDTLHGETIIIPAGSIYKRRKKRRWLNGYNFVQLNFDARKGLMVLRRYSADRGKGEWFKDVPSTGDKLDGLIHFPLPGQLGPPNLLPLSVTAPVAVKGSLPLSTSSGTSSMTSRILDEIEPGWLRLGREREAQQLEAFLHQNAENTLWIWGNKGCGLGQFLQITRMLLEREATDVVFFDAEDAAAGITVDKRYFIEKLERWASSITLGNSPDQGDDNISQCLNRLLVDEDQMAESDRRLVLVFGNIHLLRPAIRIWVRDTLWTQILESLQQHNPLAIFACEGSAPICPANGQRSTIYLAEFTVRDVEHFLRTLPDLPSKNKEISKLARKIHSGDTSRFMTSPQRVYRNLIMELGHLWSTWEA